MAARSTNLPVFVTITVDKNGQTATGGTLLPIMITLQSMGVDAIGLHISKLNLETGEMNLDGEINSVSYSENQSASTGFFSKLFK